MPSNRLSSGWLVRKGAPVLVAIDPRRGSESLRCFRGAAVAAASRRTAAAARRIAAALLVLKLDFQKGCYDAVSCSVAAPRLGVVKTTTFTEVFLLYWPLRAAVQGRGLWPKSKLAACKDTSKQTRNTRMEPFEYPSVR